MSNIGLINAKISQKISAKTGSKNEKKGKLLTENYPRSRGMVQNFSVYEIFHLMFTKKWF